MSLEKIMEPQEILAAVNHLKAYQRLLRNETNTFKQAFVAGKVADVQKSIDALESLFL